MPPKKPAGQGQGGGPKEAKEKRAKAIAEIVHMLDLATRQGRKLKTKAVMDKFSITRPTALDYITAASQKIAEEGAGPAIAALVDEELTTGVDTQPTTVAGKLGQVVREAIATATVIHQPVSEAPVRAVDIPAELTDAIDKLKVQATANDRILEIVKLLLLSDDSGKLPTLCDGCGKDHVDRLGLSMSVLSLRRNFDKLNLGDLAKFQKVLLDNYEKIAKVVDTYGGIMEIFYNAENMQKLINANKQAISEICPEHTKAIADRTRQILGMQRRSV